MKKLLRVSVLVLLLLLTLAIVVHAQEGEPAEEAATGGEIALLLAPLVAAATAIERMIEMVFSYFESMVIGSSRFVGLSGDYVKWAQERVAACRKVLLSTDPTDNDKIRTAEEALRNAEQRLKNWVQAEPYTSIKRGLSVVFGIILGIIMALVSRLQMFKLLGIDLIAMNNATGTAAQFLASVDMVVTGLIIGTGSAPVHSLIGILQKSKDTIDEVRALTRAKSIDTLGLVPSPAPSKGGVSATEPTALEMERLARRMLD